MTSKMREFRDRVGVGEGVEYLTESAFRKIRNDGIVEARIVTRATIPLANWVDGIGQLETKQCGCCDSCFCNCAIHRPSFESRANDDVSWSVACDGVVDETVASLAKRLDLTSGRAGWLGGRIVGDVVFIVFV